MFIVKRIAILVVMIGFAIGSSSLIAVSAQDKKKIEERKAKRTKEKTKGKAKAKSSKKSLVAKKSKTPEVKRVSVAKKAPVGKKAPATKVSVSTKTPVAGKSSVQKVDIATLPAPITSTYYGTEIIDTPMPTDIPANTNYYGGAETIVIPMPTDVDMPPTDMPAKLSVALIAMLPENVKNRVENVIISFSSDAQTMFKNIYLLCWIDDELMKTFNSSDFYSTLLTVISQECDMSYAAVEAMAMAMKDTIDSTLVRFENAITAGDMSSFDIQQVRDLFQGKDSYSEYLERSLRLATEYNQSKMIMALKLALVNAGSAFSPAEDEDFDY